MATILNADFCPPALHCLRFPFYFRLPHSLPPGPTPLSGEVLDVIMKCVQQQDYDILSLTFNFWYLVADGVECEAGAVRQQLRELRTAIGQARDAASKAQFEAQIPQVTAAMHQVRTFPLPGLCCVTSAGHVSSPPPPPPDLQLGPSLTS